ncbi:5-formyltetrahydrofolate cyclo-ligase [Stylophora pistillata]|uniref:5-formyltetrahydrofolate cyclo-ligase n=1 Tax=Stylophora pistillata TaxID=50429 RepID=A0A2B4SES3_STYPI|nr:5-formyltetrahydrofolate cyclo-ligase [Stylophora pistillata]
MIIRECFIPRYIGPNMDMVKLHSMEDMISLPVTSWNIQQPAEDDEREEAKKKGGLDLIVVPGLEKKKEKNDSYIMRCIETCKKKPLLVGLEKNTQICDDLPVTERDMPLDHVITSEPA